jgi:hypothetical protein
LIPVDQGETMKNPNFKLLPVALLAAALAAACGGRTTEAPPAVVPVSGLPGLGDIATSVSAVVGYTDQLIATDENSDPVDVNGLTLAADETSEAATVNF